MSRTVRALVTGAAVLSFGATAAAQTAAPGTTPGTGARVIDLSNPTPAECLGEPAAGPWMVVAPYAWIFGIHGTVGAGERTVTVDQSVSDAVDAATKSLKGAAQLHVETGSGDVGLIADLTYMRLQPGTGPVTVDSRNTLFELLGMYRVVNSGGGAGAVTLDLLAGGRLYRFRNDISGSAFGFVTAERSATWIDLVAGARAGLQVTDDLGVFARGDVGGFGIGHSSERACNVVVGFEYKCCECASLLGGYRWLKIDRESGVGRDRFVLDATLAGPFMAFALRF